MLVGKYWYRIKLLLQIRVKHWKLPIKDNNVSNGKILVEDNVSNGKLLVGDNVSYGKLPVEDRHKYFKIKHEMEFW